MSLVGQKEFEQLSKLVEELLEWREEAEEELVVARREAAAARTEAERVREAADAAVASMRGELSTAMTAAQASVEDAVATIRSQALLKTPDFDSGWVILKGKVEIPNPTGSTEFALCDVLVSGDEGTTVARSEIQSFGGGSKNNFGFVVRVSNETVTVDLPSSYYSVWTAVPNTTNGSNYATHVRIKLWLSSGEEAGPSS